MKLRISGLLAITIFAAAQGKPHVGDLTTLISFNGTDGSLPVGSLIADANGNLFGTTSGGGKHGAGTVFEIAKTATGYRALKTLVSFNRIDGSQPQAGLFAD